MVKYNGHIVGFCTARRAHLVDDFDAEIDGERIGPFLLGMCAFAGEVLNGRCTAPYDERRARAFARAMLIPGELLEHPGDYDVHEVARWIGMSRSELRIAFSTPRRRDRHAGRRRRWPPRR